MINKAVALGMSLCILLTGCGVSEEATESNSNTVEPRQITLKKSETTPILLDDSIAATTNDIGDILNELDSKGYNSQSIKQSAGILDTGSTNEVKLTRYQVAAIASNMIEQRSATPDMTWYQIDYTDNSEIPDNYVQDICIVDKAGVMQYDDEFNGYSNVSKEELQSIIDKTLEFISAAPKNQNHNTSDEEDTEIGIGVGEEIHREVYEDKLNGASVAVVKEPKTTGELNLNIESVEKVDLTKGSNTSEFAYNKRTVDYEILNLDQCLSDYSLLDTTNIIGAVISEPYNFRSYYHDIVGCEFLSGDILLKNIHGIFTDAHDVVTIRDNKITSVGRFATDILAEDKIIYFTEYFDPNYEYLGIICFKDYLDGMVTEQSKQKVLLMIPKEG